MPRDYQPRGYEDPYLLPGFTTGNDAGEKATQLWARCLAEASEDQASEKSQMKPDVTSNRMPSAAETMARELEARRQTLGNTINMLSNDLRDANIEMRMVCAALEQYNMADESELPKAQFPPDYATKA